MFTLIINGRKNIMNVSIRTIMLENKSKSLNDRKKLNERTFRTNETTIISCKIQAHRKLKINKNKYNSFKVNKEKNEYFP